MNKLLSASELKSYCECPRKRYYSSSHYLNLRPVEPNGNLLLGSKIHQMLEFYYTKGTETPFELTEIEKSALKDNLAVFNCIHEIYIEQIKEDLRNFEVLETEMPFELVDFPFEGVTYHGFIDMVVKDKKDGTVRFFENKTSKDFRPEIYNRFDVQLHLYSIEGKRYCEINGFTWGGIVLNEIKKAKTSKGYGMNRVNYVYDDKEEEQFIAWLRKKTLPAVSDEQFHEPCNDYMACKMCDYKDICLEFGYGLPTYEQIVSTITNEDGENLYKTNKKEDEQEDAQ